MYTVDTRDKVVQLGDVPQSSVGAPCPSIVAGEHHLSVAFFLEEALPGWDGSTVRVVGLDSQGEPAAVVRFSHPYASMFGPPNDEAFSGHPLASRGLTPYSAFEVMNSSWIRVLARMNAVHPHHSTKLFSTYRHFVLSFHDTTFECVAKGYSVEVSEGSVVDLVTKEAERLGQ